MNDQPHQNDLPPMNTLADVKAYLVETVAENQRLRERVIRLERIVKAAEGLLKATQTISGAEEIQGVMDATVVAKDAKGEWQEARGALQALPKPSEGEGASAPPP